MKPFSNILFVADSSITDKAALTRAQTFAMNNQAKLTVVSVVDAQDGAWTGSRNTGLQDSIVDFRREEMQALVNSTPPSEAVADVKVLVGRTSVEVIREVLRNQHDLVIKGAEIVEGIGRKFSGTDLKLLRLCPCPLWVIKQTTQKKQRRVLAAVAYDPDTPGADALNAQILEVTASVVLADFAEPHVVNAWQLEFERYLRSPRLGNTHAEVDAMVETEKATRRRWIESLVDEHCASQADIAADYLRPTIHMPKGDARRLIPDLAAEIGAELIVMGTVGRTGIPGFVIGNTAETILNQIDCSVLVVKPAGFISPVVL